MHFVLLLYCIDEDKKNFGLIHITFKCYVQSDNEVSYSVRFSVFFILAIVNLNLLVLHMCHSVRFRVDATKHIMNSNTSGLTFNA